MQLTDDYRREGPFYAVYDGKIKQGDRFLRRGEVLDPTGFDQPRLRALHAMNDITCTPIGDAPPKLPEAARGGGTAAPIDKRGTARGR